MALVYNSGYIVVDSDPNNISEIQGNQKQLLAILENGSQVYKFVSTNNAGQKWVEMISDEISGQLIEANNGYGIRSRPNSLNPGYEAVDLSYSLATEGAKGSYSFAAGYSNNISGFASTGFGEENEATNSHSIVAGKYNHTTNPYTTAFGKFNTASGSTSFTIGDHNTASNVSSGALGHYIKAINKGQVCVGVANIGTSTDTRFEVGIGTEISLNVTRKNGFEVYEDGTLVAPECLNVNINSHGSKSLITKEYFDSNISGIAPGTVTKEMVTWNNSLGIWEPGQIVNFSGVIQVDVAGNISLVTGSVSDYGNLNITNIIENESGFSFEVDGLTGISTQLLDFNANFVNGNPELNNSVRLETFSSSMGSNNNDSGDFEVRFVSDNFTARFSYNSGDSSWTMIEDQSLVLSSDVYIFGGSNILYIDLPTISPKIVEYDGIPMAGVSNSLYSCGTGSAITQSNSLRYTVNFHNIGNNNSYLSDSIELWFKLSNPIYVTRQGLANVMLNNKYISINGTLKIL